MLERLFNASWYGKWQWTWCLWPLLLLVSYVTNKKRQQFLKQPPVRFSAPVIVVGNITIGGTGKTPVVQSVVRYLQGLGYKPGIVSRGYGGQLSQYPHLIAIDNSSAMVGDEPYMLFQSLQVPVVVDPQRRRGVERLLKEQVDVVISDDGLQHYQLHRDFEICVIDGFRGLGNQQLMPVGPLRESKERLNSVDYVLKTAQAMGENEFVICPEKWVSVKTGESKALNDLSVSDASIAIAGIGNPEKFRKTLLEIGVDVPCKWFPDHYLYKQSDFDNLPKQVIMTEKDAVKIKPFAHDDMWYLQVSAQLPSAFQSRIKYMLDQWVKDHG